ncbi:Replication initiator protein A (RepA) N-terminus [Desulfitobacterium hafniense]|uniref:Replication initiator protein A (RepA) N-terminus n=1 Tax=Desulfitobacterium hafniense TaxID=49338 RepID=A0A098AXJ2_DESHA|nr:replication initiator protein A [Desulfitobacterium hafniense]CDX00835.1 Replication initiator protein A (RepA) N-terminus [Desulfitobacterium hafniense]
MAAFTLEELRHSYEFYQAYERKTDRYIKIPKQLYSCPFYRKYLTPTTREIYAFLKDRMSLSEETTRNGNNSFVDENGYIYLIFTREKIIEKLAISKQTVADAFKMLNLTGLIYEKRMGRGLANRIYIGKVLYLTEEVAQEYIANLEKYLATVQKSKNSTSNNRKKEWSKNLTSKSLNNGSPKVKKLDANNTDIINTNLIVEVGGVCEADKYEGEGQLELNIEEVFTENICDLKPLNREKLRLLCKQWGRSYILTVIEYCTEIGMRTYAGFNTVIQSFIAENLKTPDEINQHIDDYRKKHKENKKNTRKSKIVAPVISSYQKVDKYKDFYLS